jgi:hypothetical protein
MDDRDDAFRISMGGKEIPVYQGITKRKHILEHQREKQDFFYMDTGYFGNFISPGNPGGKKLFHRIVKNDLQKHWVEEYPSDRWQEICKIDPRYQWNGWKIGRRRGNKILVIVPNRKSCVFYGYDTDPYIDGKKPWLESTIETIKKHTDKEIIIREKGSRSERQHNSIYDALDQGVFATVAFNSIAAIESIAYGIPAFVTVPCAASPLALTDLTKIAKPYYPDETLVQQHCASLAYGQFTAEEIINGTAYKLLTRDIK